MNLFLKGICIGIGQIIPGFSSATVAVIFGLYEDLIFQLHLFFNKPFQSKSSFFFLTKIALGAILGVFAFSKVLLILMARFPLMMAAFFLALLLGSLPTVLKGRVSKSSLKMNDYLLFALVFFITASLVFFPTSMNDSLTVMPLLSPYFALKLILAGFIAAMAMIVPGLSGSLILLVIGMYDIVLLAVVELAIVPLMLFLMGVCTSLLLCTKLIQACFKHYSTRSYLLIAALLLGSSISLFPGGQYHFFEWVFALFIFLFVLFVLFYFEKVSKSLQRD